MVSGGNRRPRLSRAIAAVALALVTAPVIVAGPAVGPALGAGGAGTTASAAPSAEPAALLRLAPDGGASTASLDVSLPARSWERAGAGRVRTARLSTTSYAMLGLTWDAAAGDATAAAEPVGLRVRTSSGGSWGRWRDLETLHDGPDVGAGGAEADGARAGEGIAGLGATEPLWVGPSDGVQVEVSGARPAGLRLALIDPGVEPGDARAGTRTGATTGAGDAGSARATRARGKLRPDLLGRRAWGAQGSWRNGAPTYNRTLQQVHVHHTASGNGYSRADVPAMLRAMYRYHTHNLGWSDIGYNFLVDRYGRTWVGRAGGKTKLVRGAHTLGFNDTSVGVAMIGNFDLKPPTQRALTAIVRLAAWKLHRYDRDPAGWVRVYSHGSDRYAAGQRVDLPVLDGHRDTNETACPGALLYDRLQGIRRRAQERIARL